MRRILIVLLVACAAAAGTAPIGNTLVAAAQAPAVETPLTPMADTERAFAARAAEVGWKQAFLDYFAADALDSRLVRRGWPEIRWRRSPIRRKASRSCGSRVTVTSPAAANSAT